jgi:hypothetical protein
VRVMVTEGKRHGRRLDSLRRRWPKAYMVATVHTRDGGSGGCFACLEEGEGARLGRCWATRPSGPRTFAVK